MDKKITEHHRYVEVRIAALEKRPDAAAARTLLRYHDVMTRNFQHERLIHLVVTLFFAGLMLVSWGGFVAWFCLSPAIDGSGDSANIITAALMLLVLILTALEGFYIRYYYRLENRTQKLYKLGRRIYDLTE
jgi:hypothetical protein